MKRRSIGVMVALVGAMATGALLGAEELKNPIQHMESPKRTERHQMLQALAGDWTIKGRTYKDCPYGEGRFTAREHNEMMKGGLVLVSRTQYSELFKNSNQIAFFGVDPVSNQYTYALHSNLGVVVQAVGAVRDSEKRSLVGNAIEWTQNAVNVNLHGDQPAVVYTTEVVSPNEYRFKLTSGGGTWYEGVAKRVTVSNPAPN